MRKRIQDCIFVAIKTFLQVFRSYFCGGMMAKALGGFISGFSLAVFLFSLMIYIYATPHLQTMQSTYQLNEMVYASTQSDVFNGGMMLLDGVATAGGLIPVVSQYAQYAGGLKDLLLSVKDLSASIRGTLGLFIFLTGISLYLMIGSFITFILGTMIAMKPGQRIVAQVAPQVAYTAPVAVYCSECGAQNQTGAKHCNQCGKEM